MQQGLETNFTVTAQTGSLHPATRCHSPNQDERPDGAVPDLVIIHGISLPPGEFGGPHIEQLFANCLDWDAHPYFDGIRGLQVSAHALVRRDGSVLQFVPFSARAWHAGASSFRGRQRCNDFAIGIELEGEDETPYSEPQYCVLAGILKALFRAYPTLDARRVAGHCDVSPGRKSDPGPAFDWLQLYDELCKND